MYTHQPSAMPGDIAMILFGLGAAALKAKKAAAESGSPTATGVALDLTAELATDLFTDRAKDQIAVTTPAAKFASFSCRESIVYSSGSSPCSAARNSPCYFPIENQVSPMAIWSLSRTVLEALFAVNALSMGGRRSRYWCGPGPSPGNQQRPLS